MRHHEVERYHIGVQLLDEFQRFLPIASHAHNFDEGAARQDLTNDLSHICGVIDDQYARDNVHK
jgi:hypothetical protein